MATTETVVPELDAHRDRIVAEHTAHGHDEKAVRARLDAVCARFSGARVRSYLPVLVERALRDELRAA